MYQSLSVMFTTRFLTRVMRRQVGSAVPTLVDRSLIPKDLIDWYAAIATTIYDYEPRYRLTFITVDLGNIANGQVFVGLQGIYSPTGTEMKFEDIALTWK